jgi:hypothetical protein
MIFGEINRHLVLLDSLRSQGVKTLQSGSFVLRGHEIPQKGRIGVTMYRKRLEPGHLWPTLDE